MHNQFYTFNTYIVQEIVFCLLFDFCDFFLKHFYNLAMGSPFIFHDLVLNRFLLWI